MSDLMLTFLIVLAALCGAVIGGVFTAIYFAAEYRAIKDQLLESQSRIVILRHSATELCAMLEAQLAEPDYVEQPK